tara:strand:- start:22603 stop:22950 length:348 start_codon:yes stop_codon:yes gene_type:complete
MPDSELIVSLAMRRHAPREIAAQLGLDGRDVHEQLKVARRRGIDIPQFKPGLWTRNRPMVPIDMEVWRELVSHAQLRGLTSNELGTLILETVVRERLIDAVLDDGVAQGPSPAPG